MKDFESSDELAVVPGPDVATIQETRIFSPALQASSYKPPFGPKSINIWREGEN